MSNKEQNNKMTVSRPPIVVVLGHVDHGKTKLLDTIRKTNIAEKESGGVTQHIGAYQIEVETGDKKQGAKKITFLDTPGHEAFSAIRSRGAKVADIAVLVVAADESVKLQTKEAIKIIKQTKIPFVVAINKIDKEGANVQKVKQDLASEEVFVEDWGGQVPVIEVSAKNNINIPNLLEMILLVAEVEELEEDKSLPAEGVIIESNLDKRKGYVATALVKKGILSIGDWLVVGAVVGKVKSMADFMGESIVEAVPSQPVRIIGWTSAPEIGREFRAYYTKDDAEDEAHENRDLSPLFSFLKDSSQGNNPDEKYLNLVFKSDVSSSLEAVDSSLKAIKSEEVCYKVVSYDIGNISEADVKTAVASKGQVIGFRVGTEESAKKLAEKESIKITTFDIIYDLIEYVRKEMAKLLEPEIRKNVVGKLKVLAVFKVDSRAQVIGGKVTSGKVVRGLNFDLIRSGDYLASGKINQVQQNKEDAVEVKEGLEAGLKIDLSDSQNISEIKVGDILEVYQEEKLERTI